MAFPAHKDLKAQSGRLSGFGHSGPQTAQGTQGTLAHRVNSTAFDMNENYNTIYFETLNGQLDAEVETRQGVVEIMGSLSWPSYSAQGVQFVKSAVGSSTIGASDFTSAQTVGTAGSVVGDVVLPLSGALETPTAMGYAAYPDLVGLWVTINDGAATQEDLPILQVFTSPNALNVPKMKFVHASGETIKVKRQATIYPNSGTAAADIDYVSVWMQWAKQWEEQYIDVQVGDLTLAGDNERLNWQATLMTPTAAVLEVASLATPGAPNYASASSGGSIAAGVYKIQVSYTNVNGETIPSAITTTTALSGSTNTLTVKSPAFVDGATGWYAYVSQPGGTVQKRQQTTGTGGPSGGPTPAVLGTDLVLTAPPSATGVDAATLTVNGAVLSTIPTNGQNESGDSPFIQRDGGIYTRWNTADPNMYVHNRLTALNWGLQYSVQKDKVGGGELDAELLTLADRKQTCTWSTIAGQQGNLNSIRSQYSRTNKEMPIIIAFRNRKSGNAFSIVMRRCCIPQADSAGPTSAATSWNFTAKPLIDTVSNMAVTMVFKNGVTTAY